MRQPVHPANVAPGDTSSLARRPAPRVVKRVIGQQVPNEILHDADLNAAIAILPANYNFEIHKTVWRVKSAAARHVALQFPEGLLMYACVISDILETFACVEETFIMGDVTYGACCVDDYSAAALGADFLIHYGHSCLVPVNVTTIPCMYVFVDIRMDVEHLVSSIQKNFPLDTRLILAGTIQFASSMQAARLLLTQSGFESISVPQARPLSPGEVLGCTAPTLPGHHDAIVFVADGRFHLEALMIANPDIDAYRYDPYGRTLTAEKYDQAGMRAARRKAIEAASKAPRWGIVLGTLGRQGNPRIMESLQNVLRRKNKQYFIVLLSEVTPAKLKSMDSIGNDSLEEESGVDAWVQIACPRLSIDWGDEFSKPTLNPFEAFVALGELPGWWQSGGRDYPMDYYSSDGGEYSSSYHKKRPVQLKSSPLG